MVFSGTAGRQTAGAENRWLASGEALVYGAGERGGFRRAQSPGNRPNQGNYSSMVIAGLTGGTGSGKSAAARRFEHHGIPVVDADKIGHELIAPGGLAEARVAGAFGNGVLTGGAVDREKLGKRVFADPAELARLNAIVHPVLFEVIAARCTAHAAEDVPACVIDAALIGEKGRLDPWLDCLVLVSCPVEIRVQRLATHRGMEVSQARLRIAAQTDPEQKRPLARWVIDNSGSLAELHRRVDAVAASLLSYARST